MHQNEKTYLCGQSSKNGPLKLTTNTYAVDTQGRCKFCLSKEVSYDQYLNDAYCADCGEWQNEMLGGNQNPTPGPWHIQKSDHSGGLLIKPIPGQVICQLDDLVNMEANARLIAASPRLLNALEFLLSTFLRTKTLYDCPTIDVQLNAIDEAKAAIACARMGK